MKLFTVELAIYDEILAMVLNEDAFKPTSFIMGIFDSAENAVNYVLRATENEEIMEEDCEEVHVFISSSTLNEANSENSVAHYQVRDNEWEFDDEYKESFTHLINPSTDQLLKN